MIRNLGRPSSGDNTGASNEEGESIPQYGAGDSTWHRWTVPATGAYEFLFESAYNLKVSLNRGTQIDELVRVDGGEVSWGTNSWQDQVRMRFEASEEEVFYLRVVGGGSGVQGTYSLRLRKMEGPENYDPSSAFALGNAVPAQGEGTTLFAGAEKTNRWDTESSSIWWRWTAPEDGFFEIQADGSLSVSNFGRSSSSIYGRLRFEALAGREYLIKVSHSWRYEREIAIRLDRASGLELSTPESAHSVGGEMSFSTPRTETSRGTIWTNRQQDRAALWYEWTPTASGWVRVDTEGSEENPVLTVYKGIIFSTPHATEMKEWGEAGWEFIERTDCSHCSDRGKRGFFKNENVAGF